MLSLQRALPRGSAVVLGRRRLPLSPKLIFKNARRSVGRRHALRAVSEFKTSKGTRFLPENLTVGQSIGEGSFGCVYEGVLSSSKGEQRVIMKRVKDRVQGASEMHEMEHLITVYASRTARNSVADFLGFCENDETRNRLTRGLWLVWAYQGNRTLAYYIKRRDCVQALAADLDVDEELAIPTVMRHIFQCLEDIHAAGLVHRDIKPANIIFCERDRRFKLIDLGAACDLRSGTNYRPTETILDPCYCPPEEYVLPTDAPHLSQQAAPVALAMSPLLWTQHRPDCFDTYSAGVVLLQLALPPLRTTTALRNFRTTLARAGHDLQEWRVSSALRARDTQLLDANDGEGWDLAAALLRPRKVQTDGEGNVKFVNSGAPRLGASAALRHSYVKRASAGAGAMSPLASLFVSVTGSTASADNDDEEEELAVSPRPRSASAAPRAVRATSASPRSARSGSSGSGGSAGKSQPSPRRAGSRGEAARQQQEAAAAAAAAGPSSPRRGRGGGLWQSFVSKLYDLEARVFNEQTATEKQTTVVAKLRADVAAGKVSEEALQREEKLLNAMQQGLQSSMQELRGLYGAASKFLGDAAAGATGGSTASSSAAKGGSQSEAKDGKMPKWAAARVPEGGSKSSGSKNRAGSRSRPSRAAAAAAEEREEGEEGRMPSPRMADIVSASLRFGGLAFNMASSLAESVKQDAEKVLKSAQVEREASAAYMDALSALDPPLDGSSTYDESSPRIPDSEAFEPLPEARRRTVFASYVDGLRRIERAARLRAEADFQALLSEADLSPDSAWPEFEARFASDARFAAIDASERSSLFATFVEGLRVKAEREAEEEARAEARRVEREAAERERVLLAEAGFRALLMEQESSVREGASWAQLKRQMWTDARFDAVPELRRREMFSEYYALLVELGELAPAPAPLPDISGIQQPQELQQPLVVAGLADAEEAGDDAAQLDILRAEQTKLKEEYDRLEAKLKEMEQTFKALPIIETDAEGATTYHFGSGMPLMEKAIRGTTLQQNSKVNGVHVGPSSGPSV